MIELVLSMAERMEIVMVKAIVILLEYLSLVLLMAEMMEMWMG